MKIISKLFLVISFTLMGFWGLQAQQANIREFSLTGKPRIWGAFQAPSQAQASGPTSAQFAPRAPHAAGLYLQPNQYFQEVPTQPELTGRDILSQFLGGLTGMAVGTLVGLIMGGIIGGTLFNAPAPAPWFWSPGGEDLGFGWGAMAGSALGAGVGTWMGGNSDRMRGSIWLTLLGGLVGGTLGYYLALSTEGALFLFPPVMTIGGAMLGFSISRRSWTPPQPKTTEEVPSEPTSSLRMEFLAPPSPVQGKPRLSGFRQQVGMGLFKLKF